MKIDVKSLLFPCAFEGISELSNLYQTEIPTVFGKTTDHLLE